MDSVKLEFFTLLNIKQIHKDLELVKFTYRLASSCSAIKNKGV